MANTADTSKAGKIIEVTFTGTGADWNYSTDAGFDCMHIESIIWHPSGAGDKLVMNEGGVGGPSIVHWQAYADLVTNGSFTVEKDPPDDWDATNATLTTEGSGQSGSCLMVTNSGAATGRAQQTITIVPGKKYMISWYFKKGTNAGGLVYIGSSAGGNQYYNSGSKTDATWTRYTGTFMATGTTCYVSCFTSAGVAAQTSYFDEITLEELPKNKQIGFGEKGVPLKPYIDITDCTFSDITATKIIFILE